MAFSLLRAYLDEFNDYKASDCVFFGIQGLVGPVDAWHRLQCKWEDTLDCCGVRHFHATDLQHSHREFEGWTSYQRERLVALLVGILEENLRDFRLLGSAVFMKAWDYLPGYRLQPLRNPYFLCAISAMSDATRFSHFHFNDRSIEFVFDQKSKHRQWIDAAYDDVQLTRWGSLCAARSMADHRKVTPVQVADFVAYETEKYMQKRLFNSQLLDLAPQDLRWPLRQLRSLFWGSDTTLYNWHALMLVSDFRGNYKRMCRNYLNMQVEETYDERRQRIQEIRRRDRENQTNDVEI